eukprot:CAMPEP_0176430638 /NCGR_PEP_ID=MMETSP0127-20121128/14363_1 /TAXON_ID=938130 /ORGANISM="Platyophrya macrostoma, Strain WH" /LENGTH=872 /DNA_ID=CAMNT_0017812547 /DNA_START=26 /DNA_END=2644 /DNA_ORIENTATION=+
MTNRNFRVVLNVIDISIPEAKVQDAKSLRITIDDQTRFSKIPVLKPIIFDVTITSSSPKAQLGIENAKGDLVAAGELPIDNEVFKVQEYELKRSVNLSSIDTKSPPIRADIYLLFINKDIAEILSDTKSNTIQPTTIQPTTIPLTTTISNGSTAGKGNSSPSKEIKSKVNVSNSGAYTPNRSSSSPRKGGSGSRPGSPTKSKGQKDKELFEAYLQKLVDKHTFDVMEIVKDHKDISNTILLNKKLGNLMDPNLVSSSIIVERDTSEILGRPELNDKISVTWDDISQNSPTIRKGNQEIDLSPEKLRLRYYSEESEMNRSTGSLGSPSKRKAVDNVSDLRGDADQLWESAQVEYLKKVILALDIKCKEVEMIRQDNELLKDQAAKTDENQRELRLSIEETAKELKAENDANQRQIQSLIEERAALADRVRELNNKLDSAESLNKKLDIQKNKLEGDLQDAQNELKRRGDTQTHLNHVQSKLLESEKQRNDQINAGIKRLETAAKHADDSKRAMDAVIKDNERLSNELLETQRKLAQEKKLTFELTHEVAIQNQKLEYYAGIQQLLEAQKSQRDEVLDQLKESNLNCNNLNKKIEEYRAQILAANRQREALEKSHADEILALSKKLNQAEDKNNALAGENNQQLKAIADLKSKVSVLEQYLCTKEDLNKQLDQTKQKLSKAILDRDQALENIRKLTIVHQETYNQVLELNKVIKDLNIQLNERDHYILNLRKVILEIREGNPLYIPVKGDSTDNALADYINSLTDPGKVKILFLRESEGVYQFGSKKLYVKSEGDKVQIRVGGGFVNIEDFLEQNVPQELAKLNAKDPVKTLHKNVQLHKTLAGRCVNAMQKTTNTAYSYKPVSQGGKDGSATK